jgi:hypothetical protein
MPKNYGLLRNLALVVLASCGLIYWITPSYACVLSIVIDSTTSVSGAPIPYETLTGRIFGELNPNSHNDIIQDIGLTSKDQNGDAQYISTFQITTPVNLAKRTGSMIYELPNRGGNAGWQGDLLTNCTTY